MVYTHVEKTILNNQISYFPPISTWVKKIFKSIFLENVMFQIYIQVNGFYPEKRRYVFVNIIGLFYEPPKSTDLSACSSKAFCGNQGHAQ